VRAVVATGGVTALAMAVIAASQFGAVSVAAADWWPAWLAASDEAARPSGAAHVLWQIRLPRAVFALLVGGALGLSGAMTQGLFRNPLADPGLLGVAGGAACAAALTIVVLAGADIALPIAWRPWLLPAAAFIGALAVCFTLDLVARWLTPGSISGLLLTGVALNAIAAAVIGLCTYLATDEQLRSLSFWTLGSLAAGDWWLAGVLALLLAFGAWRATSLAGSLNALALGEAAASHVGIDMARLRTHCVVLVALLTGFAVAWCGMIGFVGLIAPHLARSVIGADQRRLLPLATAIGAALLLLADTLARTLAIPAEIPVGIFTALIGGPVFLAMLHGVVRQRGGAA
jgi:iron complex transport system permease protein